MKWTQMGFNFSIIGIALQFLAMYIAHGLQFESTER
jgi:hypothetical protein